MKRQATTLITGSILAAALAACGKAPELNQHGATPELPTPDRGLLPDMTIAEPAAWNERKPTVPAGYRITAIATDLGSRP
ncbi:L-sorbosone dehydrogenase [Xanthomonas fragariae]|uniref:L-sorbosone dehydrogenase n=1 Tax=Xanthomonas fragariae TaxID=48664 RepID=A0A1Y6HJF5_9XANT|nr:hypothetical protein BER92_10515 [Xanthomonas fragariae]ENZ94002.1 L-sorbosone dehydrogenase [Xanthomonas fragariae LMG 25863]AOD18500.1 hypothetical protein BER93_10535 [Xanthomonas fragariae]SMQ95148.1 L-sorbosone dehydrogenase [Xanthomonas fragariae]SMQ99455.1 Membrane bound L-sorbosone dehydrogenase [Xanthomonas fragariae]